MHVTSNKSVYKQALFATSLPIRFFRSLPLHPLSLGSATLPFRPVTAPRQKPCVCQREKTLWWFRTTRVTRDERVVTLTNERQNGPIDKTTYTFSSLSVRECSAQLFRLVRFSYFLFYPGIACRKKETTCKAFLGTPPPLFGTRVHAPFPFKFTLAVPLPSDTREMYREKKDG